MSTVNLYGTPCREQKLTSVAYTMKASWKKLVFCKQYHSFITDLNCSGCPEKFKDMHASASSPLLGFLRMWDIADVPLV